jgi:hypothetical protein
MFIPVPVGIIRLPNAPSVYACWLDGSFKPGQSRVTRNRHRTHRRYHRDYRLLRLWLTPDHVRLEQEVLAITRKHCGSGCGEMFNAPNPRKLLKELDRFFENVGVENAAPELKWRRS